MSLFENKIAVVTGGTRGIGRAISLMLAHEKAKVFALYGRDREAAQELTDYAQKAGLEIHCLRGDLTRPEKFNEIVTQIEAQSEQLDFIIHSAASGVHREAMQLTTKHLQWTFDINVFAIHNLVQRLMPKMKSGSRLIGVTSAGGTRVIPYYSAVGASKGALESLFRHYAFELAPQGIAVNCICPGLVLTDAVDAFPEKENRIEKARGHTPTGRLTTPEDIAGLVKFLCLPDAGQIIGQTIVMDGGKTLLS